MSAVQQLDRFRGRPVPRTVAGSTDRRACLAARRRHHPKGLL